VCSAALARFVRWSILPSRIPHRIHLAARAAADAAHHRPSHHLLLHPVVTSLLSSSLLLSHRIWDHPIASIWNWELGITLLLPSSSSLGFPLVARSGEGGTIYNNIII
jgi:hypothetical protein